MLAVELDAQECCCPARRGNGCNASGSLISRVSHVASPCGCAGWCANTSGCSHFSHAARLATCQLCMRCDAAPRPYGEAFTSWQLVRSGDSTAGRVEFVSRPGSDTAPRAAGGGGCTRERSQPFAAMSSLRRSSSQLGDFLRSGGKEAAREPETCADVATEKRIFRRTCAPVIRAMGAHLRQARVARRGLVLSFHSTIRNRKDIGWGHALPAAVFLHWLCRRAQRACFVRLFDFHLGRYWGYSDGTSWDEVPEEGWPNTTRIRLNAAPWVGLRTADTKLEAMAARFRDHEAPLIPHVAIPTGASRTPVRVTFFRPVVRSPGARVWRGKYVCVHVCVHVCVYVCMYVDRGD